MQQASEAQAHRPPDLVPPIRPAAPWRVASATPISEQRLRVRFLDGTEGEVDLGPLLRSEEIRGTLFEELRDPEMLAAVEVVFGGVQWPNGADLAPDAMYDAIRAGGVWTPGAGNASG